MLAELLQHNLYDESWILHLMAAAGEREGKMRIDLEPLAKGQTAIKEAVGNLMQELTERNVQLILLEAQLASKVDRMTERKNQIQTTFAASIEDVQRVVARETNSFVPILQTKKRRLAELEAEAVEAGISGDASDADLAG